MLDSRLRMLTSSAKEKQTNKNPKQEQQKNQLTPFCTAIAFPEQGGGDLGNGESSHHVILKPILQ